MRTRRFANFGQPGLNNAYLMAVGLYHRHYPLFETALARKGDSVKDLLDFFRGLSREKGDLVDQTREWVSLRKVRDQGDSSGTPGDRPPLKEMAFREQML